MPVDGLTTDKHCIASNQVNFHSTKEDLICHTKRKGALTVEKTQKHSLMTPLTIFHILLLRIVGAFEGTLN